MIPKSHPGIRPMLQKYTKIKHGLSNARIEAVNNKIKLTIRMGYGFRNIDNLIALVILRCSGVNLPLPGRV